MKAFHKNLMASMFMNVSNVVKNAAPFFSLPNKIEARNTKKASSTAPKVKYVEDNDWWAKKDYRPQAIIDLMIAHGIKYANNFLLWPSEFEPDYTMNSFVFHRDQKRLEQQINMCVRGYCYPKSFKMHIEGRCKRIGKV